MTCYKMPVVKVTRTYRLPISTVAAVRYLVEQRKLAARQDAVVEMALALVRNEWAGAAAPGEPGQRVLTLARELGAGENVVRRFDLK